MSNLLRLENVSKSFHPAQGEKAVLRGVSLSLETGALQALLGHSGSGKTTLLRLIAGHEQPDGGTLFFENTPITGPSVERFLVYQQYGQLFPWKTVRDNLIFALRSARPDTSKAEALKLADFWLSETGLSENAESWPRTLSGGMQQRAALARAFSLQPKLLLLDEPFSGLDAVLRAAMQALLRNLCQRHHVTALFVTHDIQEALALSPRPIVLSPDGSSIHSPEAGPRQQEILFSLLDAHTGGK